MCTFIIKKLFEHEIDIMFREPVSGTLLFTLIGLVLKTGIGVCCCADEILYPVLLLSDNDFTFMLMLICRDWRFLPAYSLLISCVFFVFVSVST
jgi:hypothetical protein